LGMGTTGGADSGRPMATTAARSAATHLRWVPRREHAVVAVAVHTGWEHEGGQPLEELQGGQDELGAAVRCWSGESVEKPGLGGCEGGDAGEGMEAFEGEGRPGTTNASRRCPRMSRSRPMRSSPWMCTEASMLNPAAEIVSKT
jgi:hypothetical protein